MREYLKDNINKLALNSRNKNIRVLYRGITELKKGYQTGSNLKKDGNRDVLEDCHNIFVELLLSVNKCP
jgi:hypothetical protein